MMLPSWLTIGAIALLVAFALNQLSSTDTRWFARLRRPDWLTIEWAIPFIWTFIFICGVGSAVQGGNTAPGTAQTWKLMGVYLLLELSIIAYTPVMCKLRSLRVGTLIGATGVLLGSLLAVIVFPVSREAGWLLMPYLLWSPIGTYVTWQMMQLNPGDV